MRLDEFDYELPADRIAQVPIEPRDAARLLVDRGSAPPAHRTVRDLPELLRPGDLVVVNETKVIPARLRLHRGAPAGRPRCCCSNRPTARAARGRRSCARPASCEPGEVLLAATGEEIVAIGERTAAGDTFTVELLGPLDALELLDRHGEMPLPPYITRPARRPGPLPDRVRQRARVGGRADRRAALHTRAAGRGSRRAASNIATVELVVGLDTFQPVTEPDPLDHRMHTERYRVPADTLRALPRRRRASSPSARPPCGRSRSAAATGRLSGRTELFIHRGFDWQLVDLLMTNFHLPRTTLLMMIDAFVGERWREPVRAWRSTSGYRFLSFGDAMLLDRHASDAATGSLARPCIPSSFVTTVATDGARPRRRSPRPPAAPTARRASCRSAPAGRSST